MTLGPAGCRGSGRDPIQPGPVADVNARRAGIDEPVLAVIGGADADDHIRRARELVDAVDDRREAIVDDAAHYPNLEHPEPFNAAVAACSRR